MSAMSEVDLLRAACCIAGADGKVDDAELPVLKRLAERVGVGRASLEAMIARSETEPEFYKQQFRVLKQDADTTIAMLFDLATLDGEVNAREIEMLSLFAERLGMSPERFAEIGRSTNAELKSRSADAKQ
ncbi:MAG: hypothetical protein R3C05_07235 [Pirellulaceae bacterium]